MANYPTVYNGKEPYLFISYAHKDTAKVLPIIEKLQQKGFRIWYDAGIEAGTEWPEYIASHLRDSHAVIAFISEAAIQSPHCRQEITYAGAKHKEVLAIYLDNAVLPAGLELQLGNNQSMFYHRASSFDGFINSLITAELLRPCCARPDLLPKAGRSSYTAPPKARKKSALPKILGIGILVVALIIGAVALGKHFDIGSMLPSQENSYLKAMSLIDAGEYYEAYTILLDLGDYQDSKVQLNTIREKALIQNIGAAKAGNTVVWGSYEQDNDTSNGSEPIEWIILHSNNGLTLLVSKCGLDCQPFHADRREIPWKKCDLRAWLNDEFFYEAFSSAEQAYLLETTNVTPCSEDTRDKVFLLSEEEAELYESLLPAMQVTPYAIHQGVESHEPLFWLRAPMNSFGYYHTDYAATFCYDNSGSLSSSYITQRYVETDNVAVRPCIWLDTRSDAAKENEYLNALSLFDAGQYKRALEVFTNLGGYKDSKDYCQRLPRLILMQPFMEAAIGEDVTLGDHDFIVLEKQADRVLIVSKYALDEKDYHSYSLADPSWAECTLREWLNDGFYTNQLGATEEELSLILPTAIAVDSPTSSDGESTIETVYDRIFLLSYEEVMQYFPRENDRLLYTENNQGAPVMWWLRTKAQSGSRALYVDDYGVIDPNGEYVFQLDPKQHVRPAMWIEIEPVGGENQDTDPEYDNPT